MFIEASKTNPKKVIYIYKTFFFLFIYLWLYSLYRSESKTGLSWLYRSESKTGEKKMVVGDGYAGVTVQVERRWRERK